MPQAAPSLKLTPRYYSYLKISEGCNHRCTFCIIPSLRGDLVSRPVGSVLAEAENLVKAGVQELLVVSQDTSAYGIDIRREPRLWKGREVVPHMTDLARELGVEPVRVRDRHQPFRTVVTRGSAGIGSATSAEDGALAS